tara:strand:+ start:124 stop:504 length:381 start_codon:yes stop_codon:yes gene_type:complete
MTTTYYNIKHDDIDPDKFSEFVQFAKYHEILNDNNIVYENCGEIASFECYDTTFEWVRGAEQLNCTSASRNQDIEIGSYKYLKANKNVKNLAYNTYVQYGANLVSFLTENAYLEIVDKCQNEVYHF